MKEKVILWSPEPPEGDQGEPEQFDNPCQTCGKSLDYEGDINDICTCN